MFGLCQRALALVKRQPWSGPPASRPHKESNNAIIPHAQQQTVAFSQVTAVATLQSHAQASLRRAPNLQSHHSFFADNSVLKPFNFSPLWHFQSRHTGCISSTRLIKTVCCPRIRRPTILNAWFGTPGWWREMFASFLIGSLRAWKVSSSKGSASGIVTRLLIRVSLVSLFGSTPGCEGPFVLFNNRLKPELIAVTLRYPSRIVDPVVDLALISKAIRSLLLQDQLRHISGQSLQGVVLLVESKSLH